MTTGTTTIHERIAALAARQHGLVTRAQLLRAGLTRRMVQHRITTGRFRPLHRGVYLVGPIAGRRTEEMAAVLACRPDAFVSYRSAAALSELFARPGHAAPVDVTVQGGDRGRRPGIRPHRVARLGPDEVTEVEGVPSTAPARTLLDLASVVGSRDLERAFARAERRNLVGRGDLTSLIARHPGHRGVPPLRALLEDGESPAFTRSEAEERFLALFRKAQLPSPETNARLAGYEVDFLWRDNRLVVEVDGFAYHSSKTSFEADRRRDGRLSARGFQVMRVTWSQLADEPEAVLARVAGTLALFRG